MKKILALVLCLVLGLMIAGCGGGGAEESSSTMEAAVGSIEASVTSAKVVKDANDADAVFITIQVKNATENRTIRFRDHLRITVAQGDIAQSVADVPSDLSEAAATFTKDIEPGGELEVSRLFTLSDTTTDLSIVLTPQTGENKTPIEVTQALEK